MVLLYSIAFFSLLIGMGAIFTLVEKFPVKLLYYHYHFRKPIIWTVFVGGFIWQFSGGLSGFSTDAIVPLIIITLSVVLTYKVHQSTWFRAVYFPQMAADLSVLPLSDESEMALIEYQGVTKAYSLDYVIHHHIVNDRFKDRIVALTYCAMCRTIIPFDTTEIGPLFVASFKNANMIVADKQTGTFFQQATFNSIIGKLHPSTLRMIPFQILPWKAIKALKDIPQVAAVNKNDMRPFSLPMPGVWKKVMSLELTPGLSHKDRTFASKTRVIGITDPHINANVVYLKSEILQQGIVTNDSFNFTLLVIGNSINGYKSAVASKKIHLRLGDESIIEDTLTDTRWDVSGKFISGSLDANLEKITLSDEYWFAWKKFHPNSKLLRLSDTQS
ncbi:MAG: DUF3179 domain-containing protein [Flavobacteriales bacterium]|nr:DUF3179 domain-containing protein [Flavobacteriales bacterium]